MTCKTQTEYDLLNCASHLNGGEVIEVVEITTEVTDQICVDIPEEMAKRYRDIEVVIRGAVDTTVTLIAMTINGDVGSNYSSIVTDGDSNTESLAASSVNVFSLSGEGGLTNSADAGKVTIYDFAGDRFKAMHLDGGSIANGLTGNVTYISGRGWWLSTDPITQICFTTGSGADYLPGTTVTVTGRVLR